MTNSPQGWLWAGEDASFYLVLIFRRGGVTLYLAMGLWHCLSISDLVGKLFKIGIPKFRETCRRAARTLHLSKEIR